jgi:hypothetical protein
MNRTIEVPLSVFEYFTRTEVSTAVDTLLSIKENSLPKNIINWDLVRDYNKSFLSAQQVRTEYGIFLMDIWLLTWEEALKNIDLKVFSLSPFEQEIQIDYGLPTPKGLWENNLHRTFKLQNDPSLHFSTHVGVSTEDGIWLGFSAWTGDDDVAQLAAPWEEADDGWRYAKFRAFPPSDRVFHLLPLITAAEAAIASLATR